MFHNFPKNLDRAITFNSATLKNTQTDPKKKIFFNETNNIWSWRIKKMNVFVFFSFRKITVGGFVNQLIKYSGLIANGQSTH